MTHEITQEYLQSLFDYRDGELYWKIKPSKKVKINAKCGCIHANGYLRTKVKDKVWLNHRIIFLYHHGYLPKYIDHIDTNKLNNKIENLRPTTNAQNQHNVKLSAKNTSGYKNVSFCPQTKKWAVKITVNKLKKTIGRYDDIELADLVAQEARIKYHGQFARSA